MRSIQSEKSTRRELLRGTTRLAAASALAGVAIPAVHAGQDSTVRLALIGCGGRGTGAASNALSSAASPTQLVAMADLFEDKLNGSLKNLSAQFPDKVDVPSDHQFLGLDAFKHAMDCLRPGDVVLLTTHAAYRVIHFEHAVERGLNVFMEKSFAPDPGGTRRVLAAGEIAKQKNLKVGCGLMCRHSASRQALIDQIRGGALGDIDLIRANRMGPTIALPAEAHQGGELYYQLRRPYSFPWVSSGLFIEYNIHQVDECCWIKDAWPVSAHGLGGRSPDSDDCSQNFDNYSIEYTFADGAKALVQGRYLNACENEFATWIHGNRCAAQFSGNVHAPTTHIYKGKVIDPSQIVWKPEEEGVDPYSAEWNALLTAIQQDQPHNEVERSCMVNYASQMGRAAVHCGDLITWDQIVNSDFQFCPDLASFTEASTPPAVPDAQGRYVAPDPKFWQEF